MLDWYESAVMKDTTLNQLIGQLAKQKHEATTPIAHHAAVVLQELNDYFIKNDGGPDKIAQIEFDTAVNMGLPMSTTDLHFYAELNKAQIHFSIADMPERGRMHDFWIFEDETVVFQSRPALSRKWFIMEFYQQIQQYYA
jgi:hypothetical protein